MLFDFVPSAVKRAGFLFNFAFMDPKLYVSMADTRNMASTGDGNVYDPEAARKWLSWWLASRKPQLESNSGGVPAAREYIRQIGGMQQVPVYPSVGHMREGYGSGMIRPEIEKAASMPEGPARDSVMALAGARKYHLSNAESIASEPGNRGLYTDLDRPGNNRMAYVNPSMPESMRQSTAVHELTHALRASPQEGEIQRIIQRSDPGRNDPYTDSPTEIYSRLMQFRHGNNMDPGKKFTSDDLKEMRKSSKDFNLLNRYSDETILELLNNVASVSRKDDGTRNA